MSAGGQTGISPSLISESPSLLREVDDPTVNLYLAVEVDGIDLATCEPRLDSIVNSVRVKTVFSTQNADGS